MSSATRTRATLRATALALTLAFYGAQFAGSLHHVRHVHVVCPEHGETVDVEIGRPVAHVLVTDGVDSPDASYPQFSQASHADAHQHPHCSFVMHLRSGAQATARTDSLTVPAAWQTARRLPGSVPALPTIALLRLAPKGSPPMPVG